MAERRTLIPVRFEILRLFYAGKSKQIFKMSGVFKNAKKKVSQSELRKFMHDHKSKTTAPLKKIESPLAKYNEAGQLTCVLCKSVVRSEAVWNVHINAKQHKENVEIAKKLKERTNNFSQPLKRPLTPPMVVPTKKVKGILKNAKPLPEKIMAGVQQETVVLEEKKNDSNGLPSDFFDSKIKKIGVLQTQTKPKEDEMEVEVPKDDSALPEGFFDDPKLDAKARNIGKVEADTLLCVPFLHFMLCICSVSSICILGWRDLFVDECPSG